MEKETPLMPLGSTASLQGDDRRISERVDPKIFYIAVSLYLTLTALMGIFIEDLSFIFGILGAIQELSIMMFFPAIFMILSLKQ